MPSNKSRHAFTLLELLIAIALASFVFLGLMQTYRNTVASLQRGRDMMLINRKACLLFNQLERDITTAYIPRVPKKENPQTKPDPAIKDPEEPNATPSKNKRQKTEEEALKNSFVAKIKEDETIRITGTKYELFKSLSLINTNPLQIHGQTRPRLVRVVYELIRNREESKPDKPSYNLMRKETFSLENVQAQETESEQHNKKKTSIRSHLVADHVKGMYLTYMSNQQQEHETDKTAEETKQKNVFEASKEEIKDEYKPFFTWPEQAWHEKQLPQLVNVKLILWTQGLGNERVFDAIMPIMVDTTTETAQPDKEPTEVQPAETDKAAEETEEGDKKPQSPSSPAQLQHATNASAPGQDLQDNTSDIPPEASDADALTKQLAESFNI